jgi:CubicO group peptidase (beta-lactamase class C family)
VKRGLVDLDAPLARYVPGFSLRKRFPGRNVVTVRAVLDHHSGVPGTLPKGMITTGEPDPGYTDYMLRTLRSLQPTSRVNVVGAYDNSGYVLLGSLVRHVTGMNLEAYAQRYLPADGHALVQLRRPACPRRAPEPQLSGDLLSGQAHGFDRQAARVRQRLGHRVDHLDRAGHGRIPQDARLAWAGQRGRVLQPASLRAMWTPQTNLPLDRWSCCSSLGWTRTLPQLDWAGPVVYKGGDTQYAQSMVMALPTASPR